MEVKDIINNLDNFDNGLLDDIVEQILNVKKKREKDECYELVELLKPMAKIVSELESKNMCDDIGFLATCKFQVIEDCDGNSCIVLE